MYRVRTVFQGVTGSPWVSTAAFDESVGTAQQAVTAVGAFWNAVDSLMEASVTWSTNADVETVTASTGQVTAVTATTPVTGNGTAATTGLPVATQGLVRWRTGVYVGGREIRGRWFIPGLSTAQNNDGAPTAAAVLTINNAASALIADPDTRLMIWSRKNGQQISVTSGTAWTQFAVLRSRRD